jgi:hypothetical protein
MVFEAVLTLAEAAPPTVGATSPMVIAPATVPTDTKSRSLVLNCMLLLPPRTTEVVTSSFHFRHR